MDVRTSARPDIEAALSDTERAGLSLVLTIRSGLVLVAIFGILGTMGLERGLFGASVALIFLLIGLAYRVILLRRQDRAWMRYVFVTVDIVLLAFIAAVIPLSQQGDVPQILVFRVYSMGVFFFVLATAALSLSPGLVLWAGGAIVAAIWAAWGWIVLQMDRVVNWSHYEADPTPENYIRIVLDPDMTLMSNRIADTITIIATSLVTAAAVQRARDMLRRRIASERERAEVTEVFGRFVPEEVVDTLSHSGGALPPASRTASVMFVDIEGFTAISESLEPVEIVRLLDSFFDAVGILASAERGVCISLIGDAALVAFNAPLDNPEHAVSAIATARALLARVDEGPFDGHRLSIRIGIATGAVAAGTVGGQGRRTYTLYGDTVNLAQRLEAHNKSTGTHLLIDEATWHAAGAPELFSSIGAVEVRGREQAPIIYALATPEEP